MILRKAVAPNCDVSMVTIAERITVNPDQCGGRPCIRGMRIRVSDVLDLLANGLSFEQILEELPDLEYQDIQACLRLASRSNSWPEYANGAVRSTAPGTLQGVERTDCQVFSFQGHPEASPGPHDLAELFDRFIGMMTD